MDSVSPPSAQLLEAGPILLYDGECGVCAGSVQWILGHEKSQTLRFAALQSSTGLELRKAAGIGQTVDSLIWVESENGTPIAQIYSSAVVKVLKYVGGAWSWLSLMRFVPPILRDAGYRLFARHRLKFAPTQCLVPQAGTRERFLQD